MIDRLNGTSNPIREGYEDPAFRPAVLFEGLAITHHGGPPLPHDHADRPRYVSAGQVASIQGDVVRLTISDEESRHLPVHRAPESAEILPENASLKERDIEKHSGAQRTY